MTPRHAHLPAASRIRRGLSGTLYVVALWPGMALAAGALLVGHAWAWLAAHRRRRSD